MAILLASFYQAPIRFRVFLSSYYKMILSLLFRIFIFSLHLFRWWRRSNLFKIIILTQNLLWRTFDLFWFSFNLFLRSCSRVRLLLFLRSIIILGSCSFFSTSSSSCTFLVFFAHYFIICLIFFAIITHFLINEYMNKAKK